MPIRELTRLDLTLLLPDVKDVEDACVARLVSILQHRSGVVRVHVLRPGEPLSDVRESRAAGESSRPVTEPKLCLHYDPERITLAQVTALAKMAGAQVSERFGHVVIPFRGVGTEDEGRRLEAGLRALPGVTAAAVNYAGQVARIEFDRSQVSLPAMERRLADLGVLAEPGTTAVLNEKARRAAAPSGEHMTWYARNRELAWSLVAGGLLVLAWITERSFGTVPPAIALYVASYFLGARDNVGHLLGDLRRRRFQFNIDLLMVVAAVGAAVLGEWAEGALLLFLFSLGHALEHYALGRARNAIKALAELVPQSATVLRDGREQQVPIEDVRKGDRVVIKPAERIPVDGVVFEGRSSVNQAPITGESIPVEKVGGAQVFAGSVNGEGALVVDVKASVGDRTLDRVIKLVAEAQTQKAPTQQFTDRFERMFVPIVLVADALLIVVPPLVGLWSWSDSFYRAMALLVAASPCALALGTPAAVLAGIAQAARNGVLIKGGAYLETLGIVHVLALDKTGTITEGEPKVTDIVPAPGISEDELLAVSAAVEMRSQHPLARAVVRAAEARSLTLAQAGDLQSITGHGVRAAIGQSMVEVGRLLMFEDGPGGEVPAALRSAVATLEASGKTTMVVRRTVQLKDQVEWLGTLGVADEPRAGVRETLDQLRTIGIRRIVMLTGDNQGVGEAIARAVGIDEVRSGLLPEDKVTAITELAEQGRVAMVGDGVNDAPALAHATVGIAMGGAGTAAALETADVALMGDDLGRLPFAIGLSRQARTIIKQNLFVSLAVIGLLIVATITGLVGIGPAVVVHEGSTLIVIANALRLLTYGRSETQLPTRQARIPVRLPDYGGARP